MPPGWPRYVSRAQVVEYLERYAEHFGIEPRFGCAVARIEPDSGTWRADVASGDTFRSRHVIIATGTNRVPVEPDWPGRATTSIPVMHSRLYRNPEALAGSRVLVVGMGNTGAEIALDLAEHGASPVISVRGPVNIVRRDVLGMPTQLTAIRLQRLGPAVAAPLGKLLQRLTVGSLARWGLGRPAVSPLGQLRTTGRTPVIDVGTLAAIKRGLIAVRPAIQAFHAHEIEFADGRTERFDHVILATGYRPGLEALIPAAAPLLDARGYPTAFHGTGELSGLYFLGFNPYDAGGVLRNIRLSAADIADDIRAAGDRPGPDESRKAE
jgi:cation diffusion facilitator CzcD-associated flavoprotein CzcO